MPKQTFACNCWIRSPAVDPPWNRQQKFKFPFAKHFQLVLQVKWPHQRKFVPIPSVIPRDLPSVYVCIRGSGEKERAKKENRHCIKCDNLQSTSLISYDDTNRKRHPLGMHSHCFLRMTRLMNFRGETLNFFWRLYLFYVGYSVVTTPKLDSLV